MKKIIVAAIVIAISSGLVWKISQKSSDKPSASTANKQSPAPSTQTKIDDEALKNALNLFAEEKKKGTDFSSGPCLGLVAPDWVLDIAHNPRQPIDDKEENQCAEFRNQQAKHFIELDPDGRLIRAE